MTNLKQHAAIVLLVVLGTSIWVFKGSEAKQKWVVKLKHKYDNRRQTAEKKLMERRGGVVLDDIEMASYHS